MAITKRLEVPGFWPIEKKTKKYTVSIQPGPHAKDRCLTLAVVLRDVLKYAETLSEARSLLLSGTVKVDGKKRKSPGFPVGLMDILTIGEETFMILPSKHGLFLNPGSFESKLKKVVNKTKARNAKTLIHFHDGTMIQSEESCKTGDVLAVSIADGKIKETMRLEKGASVLITKGSNTGRTGKLESIKIVKSPEPNIAEVAVGDKKISLPLDYVFAVGKTSIPSDNIGDNNAGEG